MATLAQQRERMVSRHVEERGVRDTKVLAALRAVRRELFVPSNLQNQAYDDGPLSIGYGQTISQPYIVALMIASLGLRGGEKVLEVGAGSGYAAAVLAHIAAEVFAIERIDRLALRAIENLKDSGCTNVNVRHADGTEGWPDAAPFDAILVSAGAPDVPKPLMNQMKIGARMVIPVGGDQHAQNLIRITRCGEDDYHREDIADVRFVPLIGNQGWQSVDDPSS